MPEPMRQSVIDMVSTCQVTVHMAVVLHLAIMSVVCQGAYDVVDPNDRLLPCFLWLIILAKSGDRKSSSLRRALEFIQPLLNNLSMQYKSRCENYRVRKASFDAVARGLRLKLEQEIKSGKDHKKTADILAENLAQEPQRPRKNQILFDDVTIPALLEQMADHTPLAMLNWDEGAPRLRTLSSQDISTLNRLFDGDDIICQRKGEADDIVKGPRLTLCVAAQPNVWRSVLRDKLDYLNDVGLLGRCLIVESPSLQGSRQKYNSLFRHSEFGREQFESRLLSIAVEAYGAEGGVIPLRKIVRLSQDARIRALDEYNYIESLVGPFGAYHTISAHASKLPNLILRMACLFTAISGDSDEISSDMYERAAFLSHHFAREQLRMNHVPLALGEFADLLEDQCHCLQQFLWRVSRERGLRSINKRDILRNGPSGLRKSSVLMPVLQRMQLRGLVSLQHVGKVVWISWSAPQGL